MLGDIGYTDSPIKRQGYKAERCKPDYELMIKRETERLNKTTDLLGALFNFIGDTAVPKGKLAELVGELVCMKRRSQTTIDRLIQEQEANGGD